jgi:hypothetical protein
MTTTGCHNDHPALDERREVLARGGPLDRRGGRELAGRRGAPVEKCLEHCGTSRTAEQAAHNGKIGTHHREPYSLDSSVIAEVFTG